MKIQNKLKRIKQWILRIVIMRYYLTLIKIARYLSHKESSNAVAGRRERYDRLSKIEWELAAKYDAVRDNAL